jgi:hypothetical protein
MSETIYISEHEAVLLTFLGINCLIHRPYIAALAILCDILIHLNLTFREKFEIRKNNPYFCSLLPKTLKHVQKISLKNHLESL